MPILDKNDSSKVQEYEEFIKHSPYGNAMQDMRWADVKSNWISEYVYLEENGKITAAMSVLGIKPVDDKMFLYAPHGPVSDFYDIETTKKLIEEAKPLIEKYNAFLLRMDPCVKNDQDLVKKYREQGFTFRSDGEKLHSFSNPRYEMMLDLEGKSTDDLLAGFSAMTRRHIRASLKAGVTSRWSRSQEDIDKFYELTEIMAKRHGITYRPKEYFERLLAAYPEMRIYSTDYEGETIACMIGLPYNGELWYMYGATATMQGKVSPGYLSIWDLIQWAHELGMKYFNMGGVFSLDVSDGLYFFKYGFCKATDPFIWIGELDVVADEDAYSKFVNR